MLVILTVIKLTAIKLSVVVPLNLVSIFLASLKFLSKSRSQLLGWWSTMCFSRINSLTNLKIFSRRKMLPIFLGRERQRKKFNNFDPRSTGFSHRISW
jgi:hypothetical protein